MAKKKYKPLKAHDLTQPTQVSATPGAEKVIEFFTTSAGSLEDVILGRHPDMRVEVKHPNGEWYLLRMGRDSLGHMSLEELVNTLRAPARIVMCVEFPQGWKPTGREILDGGFTSG